MHQGRPVYDLSGDAEAAAKGDLDAAARLRTQSRLKAGERRRRVD